MAETFVFQAEINQLLTLIINAFYSDKDVFLRELVSNASDALDKQRYVSLSNAKESVSEPELLRIRISFDADAKTLTIEDNGIGMTKTELVDNLGTIAKSGTKQFMEKLAQEKANPANLIGQFGMGFYSGFLVASTVSAYSKSDKEEVAHVWTSSASGTFEVSQAPERPRGTSIVMTLKDDCHDYLSETKLRDIFKKHSEFVSFPVELLTAPDPKPKEPEEDDMVTIETEEAVDAEQEKTWKQINTNKAIWSYSPEEVTQDEYDMFYRGFTSDWQAPLCQIHFRAEGQFKFEGMFFIPKQPPFAPDGRAGSNKGNVKLYVNRVFVTDVLQTDVLPDYLGFVKGLVDSEDLPLNISREMLQKTRVLGVIKRTCVKKIIDALIDLASTRPESYIEFWKVYGKYIRWGVTDDNKNQEKLADLLRFESTTSGREMTSLKDYVSRMEEDEDKIMYITGETRESVESSVFLDSFKKKGIEVLYMTDAIDEYMVQSLSEYNGKKLVSVMASKTENDEPKLDESQEKLFDRIKSVLGTEIARVTVSDRLVDAPCAIVTGYGPSANMERIMRAQAIQSDNPIMSMRASRVMEINMDHDSIKSMIDIIDNEDKKEILDRRIRILHGSGLLASGFTLDNPAEFAKLVMGELC
jgi:molecular chaperone HtpG